LWLRILVDQKTAVQSFLKSIEELVGTEDTFPRWISIIEESTILHTVGIYKHRTPNKRPSKMMKMLSSSRMKEMELVATEFRIFFKPDEEEMIRLSSMSKNRLFLRQVTVFLLRSLMLQMKSLEHMQVSLYYEM
jgi:hypothetical protein